MKIEVTGPDEFDMPPGEQAGKVRVWCQCDWKNTCPQFGKRPGMHPLCSVWVDPEMLSQEGQRITTAMNRYDR